MIKFLHGLLRYYDVDIIDSLSYFTHETNDSLDSFIGRGNSSIDSDSSQEAQESLWNDDYPDIPIIIVPGNDGSNRGDNDGSNRGDSDNGGSSENRSNSRENGLGKSKKDHLYIRTDISFLFKFISKYTIQHISQTINNIIPTILTDYIPSRFLYTVIGYFLIYKLYRYLSWESQNYEYEFNMRWLLPTFTSYRVPYETVKPFHRFKPLHRLKAWTHPPHFLDWVFTFNKYYSIYHLKQIRRALGLHFIRGNAITTSFHCISFADRGLRTLILRDFVASSVRVSTRIFDPISRKYLYHYFYILIYMGVGAVVWYQTLAGGEGLITPCPTGFDMDISPEFWDPTTIGPGYRKVCYLFRKDLTPTVINTYTNHFLFTDILGLPVQEDLFPTGEGGQRVIAVGTALMIAVLLTTKSLVLPA